MLALQSPLMLLPTLAFSSFYTLGMAKTLAGVLAVSIAALIFAGCGNSDTSGTGLASPKPGSEGFVDRSTGKPLAWEVECEEIVAGAILRGGVVDDCTNYDTMSGIDLSYAKLTQIRWGGRDLSGANFSYATMSRVDMDGANLSKANLSRATGGLSLQRANLSGANLSGAKMPGLQAANANLSGALLTGASLSKASMPYATLTNANLVSADLTNADLSYTNLFGAILGGADLSGANLKGANLSGVDLSNVKMDGAFR